MSRLDCPFDARVDPNVHHLAVAVLSRNILFFPSPAIATSLSLSNSLCSLLTYLCSILAVFLCLCSSILFCLLQVENIWPQEVANCN